MLCYTLTCALCWQFKLFFVELQILVALFLIGFLPMHVFMMWFHFDADSLKNYNHFWNSLKIVGFVFAYANSCVNPVALYFISTNFRKHFDQLLFSCCQDRKPIQTVDETEKPRPRNERKDEINPLNECCTQHGSNPLTSSSEQTPSVKQTNSTQIESEVS